MMVFIQHSIRFILVVLMQIFVLNNIRFLDFINPYIYITFILLLPYRFPRWIGLLLAFALGLIIDSFSNTPGIHTFATVLIAFLRNPVIDLFYSVEEGANPEPSFRTLGTSAFVKYVLSLIIIHHLAFYLLEIFTFANIAQTIWRTLLNSAVSAIIIFAVLSLKKK